MTQSCNASAHRQHKRKNDLNCISAKEFPAVSCCTSSSRHREHVTCVQIPLMTKEIFYNVVILALKTAFYIKAFRTEHPCRACVVCKVRHPRLELNSSLRQISNLLSKLYTVRVNQHISSHLFTSCLSVWIIPRTSRQLCYFYFI